MKTRKIFKIDYSPGTDVLSLSWFFLKNGFDMVSQCFVLSVTKKVISYSLVLGQQQPIALQIQNFH